MEISRVTQFFYVLACLALLLLTVKMVNASETPPLVDPTKASIRGSGCTAENARLEVHPFLHNLELTPSALNVSNASEGGLNRKTCMVALPVHVPAGKKLVISDARLVTKSQLQSSAVATAQVEAFTAGSQSKPLVSSLTPAQNGVVRAKLKEVLAESECGQDTNLRINASILAQGANAEASVKTLRVKYKLTSCEMPAGVPTQQ